MHSLDSDLLKITHLEARMRGERESSIKIGSLPTNLNESLSNELNFHEGQLIIPDNELFFSEKENIFLPLDINQKSKKLVFFDPFKKKKLNIEENHCNLVLANNANLKEINHSFFLNNNMSESKIKVNFPEYVPVDHDNYKTKYENLKKEFDV